MNQTDALLLIVAERERQLVLWGGSHDWGEGDCSNPDLQPLVKLGVLTEEVGEVARAVLEHDANLQIELIQTAAVAVAWLESL